MTAVSRPLSQNTTRLVMAESAASVILAFWLCAAVVLAFMVAWPDCRHWFVLPLLCCGVIVGVDAMDWLLGRVGLFDPIGVIGIVGLHFFFLAPLLHVVLDYWCVDVIPPPDWRYWLGVMALLNLCGLLAYRVARNVGGAKGFSKVWVLDKGMFFALVSVLLVASATLQCYVYALFGGVQEYIAAATGPDREEAFRGFGKVFMISESFPILAMMLFAVYAHSRGGNWRRSGIAVFVALACFLVATFFFGGLRGSRSTIVWNLAWAAGIAHVWLRPISMRSALVAGAFLMSFMYLYGFFKDAGTDALVAVSSQEARTDLEHTTRRNMEGLLLGDFSRSDVQAYVLHRTLSPLSDYEYRWGRTYLGAIALYLPQSVLAQRQPTKVEAGTEALEGQGFYVPGLWWSSRVYGLAGEAMLNFGPVAVPIAFLVFGFAVGQFRRLIHGLAAPESRSLLAAFLLTASFTILTGDLDNFLFDLTKRFAIPFAVVYICSSTKPSVRCSSDCCDAGSNNHSGRHDAQV